MNATPGELRPEPWERRHSREERREGERRGEGRNGEKWMREAERKR